MGHALPSDIDPQETGEWEEAIDVVVERDGTERAEFLLRKTIAYPVRQYGTRREAAAGQAKVAQGQAADP